MMRPHNTEYHHTKFLTYKSGRIVSYVYTVVATVDLETFIVINVT